MKNKSQSNNENKTAITVCWKTHMMQSDANSTDEILRQKHDAKIKRRKIARNKNKVAKCCTWEAAADLALTMRSWRKNKVYRWKDREQQETRTSLQSVELERRRLT
jgi:3-mercaptopyruvate sulfurtransferase SseA